jgi:hypothetical protein
MQTKNDAEEIVLSYIGALDAQEYDAAGSYLDGAVRIAGPAGETFGNPADFIDVLRQFRGKYDLKRVFADGEDVCVLYNLVTPQATVYMSSWYQVKGRRIVSVRTVFDPRLFGSPPSKQDG